MEAVSRYELLFLSYGRVKRKYRNKVRLLKPYKISCRKGSERWVIKVYGKETSVTRSVYELFIGVIPDGYTIVHRNMVQSDNINNAKIQSPKYVKMSDIDT